MRRRDFTTGLLLAAAAPTVRAQEATKQHRIAIITTQPVANIDDPTIPIFRAFFEELCRLGNIEGPNLAILWRGEPPIAAFSAAHAARRGNTD